MSFVLLLLVSVVLFRIAPSVGGSEMFRLMAGWSPLMALALCAGAFFPKRWALLVSMLSVVVPHFVINRMLGIPAWDANLPMLMLSVLLVVGMGSAVGGKATVPVFLGASILSTLLFHLVSNTVSFFTVPGYDASLAGWIQAQTTGLPQYSPQTWVFSAKQLAGDLLFTLVFVTACRPHQDREVPAATLVA